MTTPPGPIRVLVVDDQELVRSGFCVILDTAEDITVVGEAANGEAAVSQADVAGKKRIYADPDFRRQIIAVEQVLEEILEAPRPTTLVFNKIDRLEDPTVVQGLRVEYPGSFAISARAGEGLVPLRDFLWAQAAERGVRRAS